MPRAPSEQQPPSGLAVAPTDLAEIIDLAPSFMAVLRGPGFVLEVANAAYRHLVGDRRLIGLTVREAFPEIEGQGFFELLEGVYATGQPWVGRNIPVQLHRLPGALPEIRYLDLVYQALRGPDGAIDGVFAHGVDITERRDAEEALRKVADRAEQQSRVFDASLSAMTDFVYTFDTDGRFLYANKPLLDLLGISRAEIVGRNFFDLHYPEALASRLQRQIQHVFDTGETVTDETPYVSPTGKAGYYEYIFCPVLAAEGEVGLVAGSTRDITARKDAEEALVESDRRKTEFLAMLAHELRNPLAPIRNGVQFLRLADGNDKAATALLAVMDRQLAQMVRIIDDLLDVSRISRGKIELRLEPIELAEIVRQAVEASQPAYENMQHELTVTLPARPIRISADPTRLAQVIGNLLNNACKFTERKGRVGLTVETDADQAVVRVADSGIGIPVEHLARIFGMFTQLDTSLERSRGGLGIGLTLVKDLAEMHGGSVEAHSAGPGRGSEFVLRLPLLVDSASSPELPARALPETAESRSILVVEDNVDVSDALVALLRLGGHRVDTACDGLEAVDKARVLEPDVVLLDIGLPKLDGYEAARRIRKLLGPRVLLIAMTGWGQDDDRRRASEAGFDAHLTKPVDHLVLARSLAQPRA